MGSKRKEMSPMSMLMHTKFATALAGVVAFALFLDYLLYGMAVPLTPT